MLSTYGHKFDRTNNDLISYKVTIYFNVLGTFVKGGICGYVNGNLIVTKEKSRGRKGNTKILEQLS